jgi:hypothetical protein
MLRAPAQQDRKKKKSGTEEAVNFYNAVITHPKTESEDIETITREEALKRMAARRQKDMPQE